MKIILIIIAAVVIIAFVVKVLTNASDIEREHERKLAEDELSRQKLKEAMEAYFRLDDVSDILGEIADQPREVKEWFKVLNVERIRDNKVSDIIMNLNRFLESYQNNVGLNFVSGILNLIDHHFDSPDGRIRLLSALKAIKAFSVEDYDVTCIV